MYVMNLLCVVMTKKKIKDDPARQLYIEKLEVTTMNI